jgi:hypothetical protein
MRGFQFANIGRHDFFLNRGPAANCNAGLRFTTKYCATFGKALQSRNWIGVALQLGFVSMTGVTLRSLEDVPPAMLRHLGRQLVQRRRI